MEELDVNMIKNCKTRRLSTSVYGEEDDDKIRGGICKPIEWRI
jgi:hypothetical protein